MKYLLIALFLTFFLTVEGQEFSGRTKHKPIKRMSVSDVRKAQKGVNMYVRDNGVVHRNSGKAWTKKTKPEDNAAKKENKAEKIRKKSERYQKKLKRNQE